MGRQSLISLSHPTQTDSVQKSWHVASPQYVIPEWRSKQWCSFDSNVIAAETEAPEDLQGHGRTL